MMFVGFGTQGLITFFFFCLFYFAISSISHNLELEIFGLPEENLDFLDSYELFLLAYERTSDFEL